MIEAIGQQPNPIIQATTPGLQTGKRGTVIVNDKQLTSRPGIFAMHDGKIAAEAIHEYLLSQHRADGNGVLHERRSRGT